MDDDLVEVREGLARLRIPPAQRGERGPGSKELAPVFYNPAMGLNRDLSSLLLAARAQPGWDVLDGLSASGARGIRYALEAGVPIRLHLNDWNPVSAELLRKNADLNGLEAATVTRGNLAALLWGLVWNVVDIDPFGSPAPFLNAATRAVRHKGLLSLTATDATALAAVAPQVCRRRYDALPLHGELGHEVALRILAGSAVRTGAKHDVSFRPVFSHATDHYYRITLECMRGAKRADDMLQDIGFLHDCRACGHRGFHGQFEAGPASCPDCGGRLDTAGPLWTGPLLDAELTGAMMERAPTHPLARPEESLALLRLLHEEAQGPPLMVDLHHAGSRLRIGSPGKSVVIGKLREWGYRVAPVHFEVQGIRTDAPAKDVARAVREAAQEALE